MASENIVGGGTPPLSSVLILLLTACMLTLMKGDEAVEAIEQGTNLGLFVDARHAYLAEKQLVKEEVEPNATLL